MKTTLAAHDVSIESVAQAADISVPDLNLRLAGEVPFEIRVLAVVGGLSHVPIAQLTQGVT
ncbi:hypothetical protein [Leifsonia sp. TF02-11]|uniref:hypothetical protein n=1 Tax=Leifsonia sp. TF02-11 TaxID=2815212 RepID=UPI001AA149EC|nr:hypothetical protein [Leifsonia sp. TF02-11]MBO1739710.1 hypothetical protein [Leifsonia sp. TF02-11]